MPWELSIQYSIVRFIILMLIAILGMTGWLLYAHQLIERKTAKSQRVYRYIYNFTTVFTLFIITLGLLAGAMGSTVENEEKIRQITYSYRQYHRYKEAEQEKKEKEQAQSSSHDASNQQVEESASNKQNNDNQQDEHKKQDHREEETT